MGNMFKDIDLRELADMKAPERAFLSLYIAGRHSMADLEKRLSKIGNMLKGGGIEKDEREHFDENVRAVKSYLGQHPLQSGSLCIFSCRALDFFKVIPLTAPVKDLVWIGSSPYIRPLAELQDEYENIAVVVADNKKTRIFLVSSAVAGSEEVVRGNVKNHVKKGGWSQQRYERRRDKQLHLYANEIVEAISKLEREEKFEHILLVGSKEILQHVHGSLPQELQEKVVEKHLYLGRTEGEIHEDIMDLFFEEERRTEKELWERIRAEYLKGGLAAVGLDEVLDAAKQGRVEKMIVDRTFRPEGMRCHECSDLHAGISELCPVCDSKSLYKVGIVNEIIEMLELTGAEVNFCDPIQSLTDAGQIAALLRY
jgi:peptide subunit release factor 1 (eRF1)